MTVLTSLANRSDTVNVRLAGNPRVPAATLEILAGNGHFPVKPAVAVNPNTPLRVVFDLLIFHNIREAASNQAIPAS